MAAVAQRRGVPVIAFAGRVAVEPERLLERGIQAAIPIAPGPMEEAGGDAPGGRVVAGGGGAHGTSLASRGEGRGEVARSVSGERVMRRWLRPTQIVKRVAEIDLEALWQQGVRGLILDLDNTLVPWNGEDLTPEIRQWLEAARERGMRACIVSNAFKGRRVKRVAEALGLGCVVRAGKPFSGAFRRGLQLLGTTAAETCAIGDQVFTDMLGANRLGLVTVLVTPLESGRVAAYQAGAAFWSGRCGGGGKAESGEREMANRRGRLGGKCVKIWT